jgi:hypothetical protein
MKKAITILTFVFLFQISNGQDTIRRFEFGSTLVTINSFNTDHYFAPDRPSFEFINGLFFRYTKKRLGLRLHASYTDNSTSYATPAGWSDGSAGDINNKDFRIGVGGQFSLLKRKEWFYTFLDLSYRNVFSTGHYYGGLWGANERFSNTANGFDCFLGLGFKIKTIKNVYLSPELGYFIANKFVSKTTTDMSFGQTSKYNYNETDIHPALKLHLTVKF